MRPPTRRALSLRWHAWPMRRCVSSWATGAEGWVRNERIFDASFHAVHGGDPGRRRVRATSGGCSTSGAGRGPCSKAAVAAGAEAVGADISPGMVKATRPAGARRHRHRGRRPDRRPARRRARRALRPRGVALRGDVLRRPGGRLCQHPLRHRARRSVLCSCAGGRARSTCSRSASVR